MLNRNDPLIDSVKKVMEQNAKERAAAKSVNEKFGVVDRRALPHDKQNAWDAAYKKVLSESVNLQPTQEQTTQEVQEAKKSDWAKSMAKSRSYAMKKLTPKAKKARDEAAEKDLKEALRGNQEKIDANNNNKVDAHDFKLLRAKKAIRSRMQEATQADAIKNLMAKNGRNASGVPVPASQSIAQHTPAATATRMGNSVTPPLPSNQNLDKAKLGTTAIQKVNAGNAAASNRPAGGARPGVVAPNVQSTAQKSTGLSVGGARPEAVAKNTSSGSTQSAAPKPTPRPVGGSTSTNKVSSNKVASNNNVVKKNRIVPASGTTRKTVVKKPNAGGAASRVYKARLRDKRNDVGPGA